MNGDFSRDSFDPLNDFTRVLMQQGRLHLDADWNEQVSIFWHHWRTFVKDLFGPFGGPESNCGFGIITSGSDDIKLNEEEKKAKASLSNKDPGELIIGPGNYYVDGILTINREFKLFTQQGDQSLLNKTGKYLIYIDVWERHITHIEEPSIREVALNGADTCTRAKIAWQVRSWAIRPSDELLSDPNLDIVKLQKNWEGVKKQTVDSDARGRLKVHLRRASQTEPPEPTSLPPDSRYRGSQNQLYRVEIHHQRGKDNQATFKWSRENGSVVFPLEAPMQDSKVVVSHLGKGRRFSLQVGDWVELVDDDYAERNFAEPLWRVAEVDTAKMQITLAETDASSKSSARTGSDLKKHPYLRRWDQKQSDARRNGSNFVQGAVMITEGKPLPLENGIQIEFASTDADYRSGDYWLIPARVANGGIDWPLRDDDPDARNYVEMEPHSHHYYAPLAIVEFDDGKLQNPTDMRAKFPWWAG